MDQDPIDTIVVGDGVVSLPIAESPPQEMSSMSINTSPNIDISPNVANALLTESVGNIQTTNASARNQAALSMGVLQAAQARNFDELGSTESRAVSGVMATPIAPPTTGS